MPITFRIQYPHIISIHKTWKIDVNKRLYGCSWPLLLPLVLLLSLFIPSSSYFLLLHLFLHPLLVPFLIPLLLIVIFILFFLVLPLPLPQALLVPSTHFTHCPWEANNLSASQQIPCILWNPKVYYRVQKWQPLVLILSQMYPQSTPIPLRYTQVLPSHLRLRLPCGLFPSGFPIKYTCISHPPIRATCPANFIHLDLITLIKLGETCKLWSSSFCSPLQSPTTCSLLGHFTTIISATKNTSSSSTIKSTKCNEIYNV
jgi:hypothetical protein